MHCCRTAAGAFGSGPSVGSTCSSPGRLAFGGAQGVSLCAPDRINRSNYAPELAFTGYQVGGERRPVSDATSFSQLAVAQRDRIVGFEFAAFDYAAPHRNRFQYRLDG